MASSSQTTAQRVRVGAIGLVFVVLLIALASAILGSVARDRPVVAPGGAKPDIVANMALGNGQVATAEPLADMGSSPTVANGTGSTR